jgi:hypothetical protein
VIAALVTLAGCGAGDSTVAKTPQPPASVATTPQAQPPPPAPNARPPAPAAPNDPCAVNLASPEIGKAVAGLPPDPRSGQAWSSEPVAGNFNECAQLSAVIVKANTNAGNPNTRAVMFHQGKFIPTGVPDTFGFNGIDSSASTGDMVALKYSSGVSGLDSTVRFRWNGNSVELVANTA